MYVLAHLLIVVVAPVLLVNGLVGLVQWCDVYKWTQGERA